MDKIYKLTLLTIPILMAFFATQYFKTSPKTKELFAAKDGEVAGAKDENSMLALSKTVPIIPKAEILSVTKSNNNINLLLQANQSEKDIRNYYENYLKSENWQLISKDTYKKGFKLLTIDIHDEIIKISLTSN